MWAGSLAMDTGESGHICYNGSMSEAGSPYADGMLDGWALAAALHGGIDEASSRTSIPLREAVAERLDALRGPAKAKSLATWSARLRPELDAATLRRAPAGARALLAPLASPEARRAAATSLASLRSPRRGYHPAPGLAEALARRSRPVRPNENDRGRGRRLLATLGEDAAALLARAGAEADAVRTLGALGPGDAEAIPPESPWAMAAAMSAPDPVARFGLLVGERAPRERADLRELEASCRG